MAPDLEAGTMRIGGLANAKVLEDMVKGWLALTQAHGRGIGFAISLG